MSKEKQSKLDRHESQLEQWYFTDNLEHAEVQRRLNSDGTDVSLSRLSDWFSQRSVARLNLERENKLIANIASASSLCKTMDKQFANNPAPDMPSLINLSKMIYMKLSTGVSPKIQELALADQMMRTVMEYQSGQTKFNLEKLKLDLQERRVALLEKKAAMADEAKGVVESKLTPEEKMERIKAIFGMS